MQENIVIRGVRQNNLKGFDLTLPRNKLIVFTGLSGCGKSSLAFDTLYAEGQRRYVESLSSYARQFLGQMEKPDVDAIDGLSPAISIDQKTTSKNPRSTVGTVTEIHDYLRLLYARVGVAHCPRCGREISKQTVDQMVDRLLALPERTRMQLLAPIVRGKKGEHVKILENVVKQGFVRVRIDGEICDAAEAPALAKQKKHNIEVVVDRLILREDIRARLTDSLETALSLSGGIVIADIGPGEQEMLFSQNLACPDCGISMEELAPRSFSFNSPFGACPTCAGLGVLQKIDPDLIVPDWGKSLNENPFNVMGWSNLEPGTQAGMFFQALSEKYGLRWHHHVIMSGDGMTREEVEVKWTSRHKGFCNTRRAQPNERHLCGFAKYLVQNKLEREGRNPQGKAKGRTWGHSRGLKLPTESVADKKISIRKAGRVAETVAEFSRAKEIFEKLYPECELLEIGAKKSRWASGVYVHALMRRVDESGRAR